jgi:hypothetical protein
MTPVLPVAAFALLLAGWSPRAQAPAPQAPAGRPTDALLPGPPETITIDQPANLFAAFTVFTRVLDAAGVRYGLEGPAWDPASPPIDLARLGGDVVMLGGRRLGDALDLVVKAAPQYRWAERDGIIVVRASAEGASLLDRRIKEFALKDAAPRSALEEVMTAIDPSRPRSVGIVGFGRPGSGAGFKPGRVGRNVTLSLKDVTVQTILSGIARENGELSWTIKYDRAPADVESASLTFTELGVDVTALSPYAQRTQAVPGALPANRLTLSSVPTMLLNYGERSGQRINVEEVAARLGEPAVSPSQMAGIPPLELPDQPSAAIARIVALDSRYEWAEKNGRYLVRPKPGVAGRLSVLDEPVNGFRATKEPAGTVIERAAQFLGTVRTSPGTAVTFATAPPGGAPPPSPITAAMAQPIDVDVPEPANVRDVFNAIADVTGWIWTMRPSFVPGRPTTLFLQWRSRPSMAGPARGGVPVAAGGWSSSVTITTNTDLSPPPTPSRPPAVTIPAALDRPIPQTTLEMPPGIGPFRQIGGRALVPMGLEDAPRVRRDDPRYLWRPQPPLVVGPGPFSDGLYVLLERLTDFVLLPADGIVNVAPGTLAKSAGYFMNRPLDAFSVKGVGVFRAVGELRRRLDPQFVPADWTGAGQSTLNTAVTLSLTGATPRAILNEIAKQHGRLTWTSAFEGPESTVVNWVLTLVPLDNAGPPIALSARGGALAAAPPAATTSPLAIAPGSRPVTLDLPVTAASVRNMLTQAARATNVSMGFAGVMPASPSRPASSEYYNLTGLSMDEMLAKLVEFAPEYVTSIDNGVYHVRLRQMPSELTQWLDQRIPKFEQRFENLRDAMHAVATIGLYSGRATMGPRSGGGGAGAARPPGAAPPSGGPPGRGGVTGGLAPPPPPGVTVGSPTSPGSETINARIQKTIVLSMTNVTVREIMDEIARQFGSMQWMVELRASPTGTSPGMSLLFSSENWGIGTSVR